MKNVLLSVTALALIAGCTATTTDNATSTQAYKTFALDQLRLWNAAGVDPLQAGPETIALMAALCSSATSLSTVINAGAPDTPQTILDYCGVVIQAAAPAG